MSKLKLTEFDASEYLDTAESRAEYLRLAIESDDDAEFLRAVGDVAKSVGMSKIAEVSGLTRNSLYKSVSPTSKPQFSTILKILSALDVSLSPQPKTTNKKIATSKSTPPKSTTPARKQPKNRGQAA